MLSVSPSSVSRSQLEEMLEALQRRTGYDKPKDLPPELPTRPKSTPRTRPPSVKRPLPRSLETADVELSSSWDCNSKKENVREFRGNRIGAKEMELSESPYGMQSQRNNHTRMLERRAGLKLANSSPGSLPKSHEAEWADTIDYFIKEVHKKYFQTICFALCVYALFIFYFFKKYLIFFFFHKHSKENIFIHFVLVDFF